LAIKTEIFPKNNSLFAQSVTLVESLKMKLIACIFLATIAVVACNPVQMNDNNMGDTITEDIEIDMDVDLLLDMDIVALIIQVIGSELDLDLPGYPPYPGYPFPPTTTTAPPPTTTASQLIDGAPRGTDISVEKIQNLLAKYLNTPSAEQQTYSPEKVQSLLSKYLNK
jgi:hypothetical protein